MLWISNTDTMIPKRFFWSITYNMMNKMSIYWLKKEKKGLFLFHTFSFSPPSLQLAIYILLGGLLCIYINYDCDRQRQEFRRTNGKCLVWGKAPSKVHIHISLLLCLLTWVIHRLMQNLFFLLRWQLNLYMLLQIVASYTTTSGETKTSLLLTSGW